MSLIFNEEALRFVLEDEHGPVGLDLRRRSIIITDLVRANATKVLEMMPPDVIQYEITTGDLGLQSVIGTTAGGRSNRWSKYLASKEEREAVIFAPALSQGLVQ